MKYAHPFASSRGAMLAAIAQDTDLAALYGAAEETLGEEDDPGHDLAHCLRVALWTVRIGLETGAVEPREAIAAALLHDIVNVPKNSPDRARASALCADKAVTLLAATGFDATATARIHDAIRDHSFSRGATPQEPLGKALQDADRLEALGVIGVFRCISTGVRMGARYFHDEDPWAAARSRDDYAFSVDHFFKKLLSLHTTMQTDAGGAEARRRTDYLVATLRALGEELGEPLPLGLLDDYGLI